MRDVCGALPHFFFIPVIESFIWVDVNRIIEDTTMPSRLGSIDMLKGKIAEAIVEEMLKEAGFRVYRFGYESVIQNLTQVGVELKKTKSGRKISNMPDFIILNDEGYVHFIEVKFRSGPPDHEDENCKDLAETWPESKILFVCKTEPYFRIANAPDFVDEKKKYIFPLENDKYVKVDETIIKKYAKQVIASYGV